MNFVKTTLNKCQCGRSKVVTKKFCDFCIHRLDPKLPNLCPGCYMIDTKNHFCKKCKTCSKLIKAHYTKCVLCRLLEDGVAYESDDCCMICAVRSKKRVGEESLQQQQSAKKQKTSTRPKLVATLSQALAVASEFAPKPTLVNPNVKEVAKPPSSSSELTAKPTIIQQPSVKDITKSVSNSDQQVTTQMNSPNEQRAMGSSTKVVRPAYFQQKTMDDIQNQPEVAPSMTNVESAEFKTNSSIASAKPATLTELAKVTLDDSRECASSSCSSSDGESSDGESSDGESQDPNKAVVTSNIHQSQLMSEFERHEMGINENEQQLITIANRLDNRAGVVQPVVPAQSPAKTELFPEPPTKKQGTKKKIASGLGLSCKFCFKLFASHSNARRHERKCPGKENENLNKVHS